MMKSLSNIIPVLLIVAGVAGFVWLSKPLLKNEAVNVPLNVLGINHSPYGEVIAMAMQGPIDTYFHATQSEPHVCSDPENCNHHQIQQQDQITVSESSDWNGRLKFFIESLGSGLEQRTNFKAASQSHKFYLRRGIEDKLRFAYNLDPSHYGNYNAYHFFLTEPSLGTRPELTPHAAKLADETIRYCLTQRDDPRDALTAAAAASNIIQLMFEDRAVHPDSPRYTTAQMWNILAIANQSIALYKNLSDQWAKAGTWNNLSALRIAEVDARLQFISKVRESQEKAIRRLEKLPNGQATATKENAQHSATN